ncbi:hypothetical protein [Mycolicibacterium phlei]|jgi:hypothetical protein
MSGTHVARADSHTVRQPARAARAPGPPPVLITEQQVAFATATALRSRHLPRRRGFFAAVMAWIVSVLDRPERERRLPRHYPAIREAFMEDAAMEREMHKL